MIVKTHKTPDSRKLVAICDSELLGKKFEEGNLQLDLASDFYKGEEKGAEEVKEIIKDAYIVNVVGGESVAFCIELEIIDKKHILRIGGVPHAQAVIMQE
ncbi:DUF424 domain-containing protein [Candidatus Woesearchaeota archaeon]|nr:DUF424 domain-containing protein [Candidatus Woesearchaeota archaeon]